MRHECARLLLCVFFCNFETLHSACPLAGSHLAVTSGAALPLLLVLCCAHMTAFLWHIAVLIVLCRPPGHLTKHLWLPRCPNAVDSTKVSRLPFLRDPSRHTSRSSLRRVVTFHSIRRYPCLPFQLLLLANIPCLHLLDASGNALLPHQGLYAPTYLAPFLVTLSF